MARVTGIGGVFLRSKNPKRLTAWYAEHLGFTVSEWGVSFEWKDEGPPGTGATAWSVFADDTEYFGDEPRQAMINYRVDALDARPTQFPPPGAWTDPKRQERGMG